MIDDTINVEPERSSSRGQLSRMNGGIKEKASCQRDSKPFCLFKQGQNHNAPDLFRVSNSELSEVTLPCSLRSSQSDSTTTLNRLDPSRRLETKGLGCSPSIEICSILSGYTAYLTSSSTSRDETSSVASTTTEDTASEVFNHATPSFVSKTSLQADVHNGLKTPNDTRMTENSSLQVALEGFGIIDTTSLLSQLSMRENTTTDTPSIVETDSDSVGGCGETATDTSSIVQIDSEEVGSFEDTATNTSGFVENDDVDVGSCEISDSEYETGVSRECNRKNRFPLHLLPMWRKKYIQTMPEGLEDTTDPGPAADSSDDAPVVELPSRRLKVIPPRKVLSNAIKRFRKHKSDVHMQKSQPEYQSECQIKCQTEWEIVPTTERLEVLQL